MTTTALSIAEPVGVIASMAATYNMVPEAFERTLMNTVMPANVSKEQVAAFLLVAKEHGLNPFTKEIFAFPSRGGIQPVVSVDGWLKLMNAHPNFDGLTFKDTFDDKGKLVSVTAAVFRKDRAHPIEVTEYMAECVRDTDVWKRWPMRMLRHKAAIQAARYAFGFAGIMEPDEYDRMQEASAPSITPFKSSWEALDEEAQARVLDHYSIASERYAADGPNGVVAYMAEQGFGADETIGLLSRFPTDERRKIRYAMEAAAKQRAKLPAPPPEQPQGDILA